MAARREGIATNDANSGPSHAEPQIAPPPWQRLPDRPGRRRREPISREAIVTAAIQLLDREGLAALSMRRLAEELGTGAASLYWHVGSKDGLLDLVFDELIGEQQVPDADPSRWQEQLKDIARAQRRISLRHPYLVRISIGRIPMGPNALRFSERVIAILRAGGLPPRLAVQGYLLLIATVNGFTVDETGVDDDGRPARTATPRPATRPAGRKRRTWPAITSRHCRPSSSRTWSASPTSSRSPTPTSASRCSSTSSWTGWPAGRRYPRGVAGPRRVLIDWDYCAHGIWRVLTKEEKEAVAPRRGH